MGEIKFNINLLAKSRLREQIQEANFDLSIDPSWISD